MRWGQHLQTCSRGTHINPRMQAIHDEYGTDDWVFEILHREPINPSDEHNARWIRLLENKFIEKNSATSINGKHDHVKAKNLSFI